MRTLLVAMLLVAGIGYGQECTDVRGPESAFTLEWDANTEPDLEHYHLFMSRVSGEYDLNNSLATIPAGTEEWTNTDELADGMYFYVAQASDEEGNDSGFSNEVCANVTTADTTPPGDPTRLRFRTTTISEVFLGDELIEKSRNVQEFFLDIPSIPTEDYDQK